MTTYHGYIKEFPFVRIDRFDSKANPFSQHGDAPLFYLLTHAHADHLKGLNSPAFDGLVYATAVTRTLVTEHVTEQDRINVSDNPELAGRVRVYQHARWRDIVSGVRTRIEATNDSVVYVTAIDANHCPGSVMYLIEGTVGGEERAVLFTGDIRAEPAWVASLRKNKALSRYLAPLVPQAPGVAKWLSQARPTAFRMLDCIYIDTSGYTVSDELPSKDEAIQGLIELMTLYPSGHKFYFNTWTWGYEEILVEVERHFGIPIHLSVFKENVFAAVGSEQPDLGALATTSRACFTDGMPERRLTKWLRFELHACDRKERCDVVSDVATASGARIMRNRAVYVNPLGLTRAHWEAYKQRMTATLTELAAASENDVQRCYPPAVIVPLARHSTLPELRDLVNLFKPQSLVPLTVRDERNPAPDYRLMASLFAQQVAPGGARKLRDEASAAEQETLALLGFLPPPPMNYEDDEGEFDDAQSDGSTDDEREQEERSWVVKRINGIVHRSIDPGSIGNFAGGMSLMKVVLQWLDAPTGALTLSAPAAAQGSNVATAHHTSATLHSPSAQRKREAGGRVLGGGESAPHGRAPAAPGPSVPELASPKSSQKRVRPALVSKFVPCKFAKR